MVRDAIPYHETFDTSFKKKTLALIFIVQADIHCLSKAKIVVGVFSVIYSNRRLVQV